MKIAIFGWNGLVGSYATKIFGNQHVVRISRSAEGSDYRADAADASQVSRILEKEKPDVVINAVKSPFSTDQSEMHKEETWASNVAVPENLARLQKAHGYHLVHISSDWVYEGKDGETYSEESCIYPQNFYSFTKAIAEERVRNLAEDYIILRPTGIFGVDARGANFFMRVKNSMEKGETTPAASDQFSQPIYAGELARIILAAVDKNAHGIYNAVGKDYLSRYELAILFCDVFHWDKNLIVPQASVSRGIRIPGHLHVDISKLEKDITKVRSLKSQMAELKTEIGGSE